MKSCALLRYITRTTPHNVTLGNQRTCPTPAKYSRFIMGTTHYKEVIYNIKDHQRTCPKRPLPHIHTHRHIMHAAGRFSYHGYHTPKRGDVREQGSFTKSLLTLHDMLEAARQDLEEPLSLPESLAGAYPGFDVGGAV